MRVHYFQHVAFEGLGSIEAWLNRSGHEKTCTRFFEAPVLPTLAEFELLVVMGGPMSVNEERDFPWLVAEKEFIRAAILAGKAVLGVCLGAQLIASALGARVVANGEKEIGWFPVQGISVPGDSIFRLPPSLEAFHWHGETFALPAGAIRLAKSEACENQAFQFGRAVIGLQFHLETTPESARELVANCREELLSSTYVQTEETILAGLPEKCQAVNNLMSELLDYLVRPSSPQ